MAPVVSREGESADIICPYDPIYKSNTKSLCKGKCSTRDRNHLSETVREEKETKTDRLTLKDDVSASVFTGTITGLTAEDAGKYWCAVTSETDLNYLYTHLMVIMNEGEEGLFFWICEATAVNWCSCVCNHFQSWTWLSMKETTCQSSANIRTSSAKHMKPPCVWRMEFHWRRSEMIDSLSVMKHLLESLLWTSLIWEKRILGYTGVELTSSLKWISVLKQVRKLEIKWKRAF